MTEPRLYYAVGDIHGEFAKLQELHAAIFENWAVAHDTRPMTLVHLGDYVDRGPDARAVIERLISLEAEAANRDNFNVVNLFGNHEQMMLDAVANFAMAKWEIWQASGGEETIRSYDGDILAPPDSWLDPSHFRWIRDLPTRHISEDGRLVFVHAGISPDSYPQCPEPVRIWTRSEDFFQDDKWPDRPELAGITVVHGHTPVIDEPYSSPRRINLDTGACFGGPLTAAILAPGEPVRFLRAGPDAFPKVWRREPAR